jgi:hypothetical protein
MDAVENDVIIWPSIKGRLPDMPRGHSRTDALRELLVERGRDGWRVTASTDGGSTFPGRLVIFLERPATP